MKCPRCNSELDFILVERVDDKVNIFEYLCMQCLLYYQEVYDLLVLAWTVSGDLGK